MIKVKKGISHIEIILAFVLFIGFVGFALFFFRPTDTSRLVDTSLIYTFDEIEKKAGVEVGEYVVKISDDIPEENINPSFRIPDIDQSSTQEREQE